MMTMKKTTANVYTLPTGAVSDWGNLIWTENRDVLLPLFDVMVADPAINNAIRAAVQLENEGRKDEALTIADWLLTQPSYRAFDAAYQEIHSRYVACAEPNPNSRTVSPACMEAIGVHLALVRVGRGESDEGHIAMMRVMDLAPDWLLDEFGDMGREMGVMPSKPTGYTTDGEPMYSLDSISAALGISDAEAAAEVERFMARRERAGLSNAGIVKGNAGIHSVQ